MQWSQQYLPVMQSPPSELVLLPESLLCLCHSWNQRGGEDGGKQEASFKEGIWAGGFVPPEPKQSPALACF